MVLSVQWQHETSEVSVGTPAASDDIGVVLSAATLKTDVISDDWCAAVTGHSSSVVAGARGSTVSDLLLRPDKYTQTSATATTTTAGIPHTQPHRCCCRLYHYTLSGTSPY